MWPVWLNHARILNEGLAVRTQKSHGSNADARTIRGTHTCPIERQVITSSYTISTIAPEEDEK